jgi:NPCBM-associated, NEW3 domain of alpha-galactosidase
LGKVAGSSGAAGTTSPSLDLKDGGEYQLLRLTYPPLQKMLWLKEIEAQGEDGALLRAAERFTALAQNPSREDLGLASQLAIALRVRRMLGHGKTLQERALNYLTDFCSTASGVFVALQITPEAPPSGLTKAYLVIANHGDQPLHEGGVKLKLPPGWSAAPTKFEVDLPPGQTIRLPVTLLRAAEGGHLTLLVTGSVGADALFMSRWL